MRARASFISFSCAAQARRALAYICLHNQSNTTVQRTTHAKLKDQAAQTVVDVKAPALILTYKNRCYPNAMAPSANVTAIRSPEPQRTPASFLETV